MLTAYLTTPAGKLLFIYWLLCNNLTRLVATLDVIKTRLQVEAREGQAHYAEVRDAL